MSTQATSPVTLQLTQPEHEALQALAAALGELRDLETGEADALIAATELGLVHLLDRYELPEMTLTKARTGLEQMRNHWIREGRCL